MLTAALLLVTLAQAPQPLTEYDQQFLTVEDTVTVTGGESSRDVVFTQGKYRRELDAPEFLQAIGRAEEAERYRTRRKLAGVMAMGSFFTMLLGALATASGEGGDDSLVFTAAAAGALLGGAAIVRPRLPEAAELRRLADEHNQALERRLTGLSLAIQGRF